MFYFSQHNTSPVDYVRVRIWRLLIFQALITSLISVVFWSISGWLSAYSAFLGGVVIVIPNWCFANMFFSKVGARAARQIIHKMFLAETIKILLMVLLIVLVFTFLRVKMLPFLVAFICVQSMFWFSPWLFKENKKIEPII